MVQGRLNAEGYNRILIEHMIASAERLLPDGFLFQHDNAPIHTAKSVKAYLAFKGVNLIDWPPQSPDLNPIENLWFLIEHSIKNRPPNTEDELFVIIQNCWDAFATEQLEHLTASMHNRCELVIKNKGHAIKY